MQDETASLPVGRDALIKAQGDALAKSYAERLAEPDKDEPTVIEEPGLPMLNVGPSADPGKRQWGDMFLQYRCLPV